MADKPEEPLSSEESLERFTKIFRKEMTAVERRDLVISNDATLQANATQHQKALQPASAVRASLPRIASQRLKTCLNSD